MGAVKFMSSGADVMRPGITELDHEIKKDEIVVVVDQTHKKPLCVSKALFSGVFRAETTAISPPYTPRNDPF